jgi:predicted lactoylglutathione lyase
MTVYGRRMEQRVSLVTLGVADLDAARGFYERLGWRHTGPTDDVVFFQAGGIVVALWSRAELAADTAVADSGGWGGITLAHNVTSPDAVDTVLAEAERCGGTVRRPAARTDWGGYGGVFSDPDGHCWEVAHNRSGPSPTTVARWSRHPLSSRTATGFSSRSRGHDHPGVSGVSTELKEEP